MAKRSKIATEPVAIPTDDEEANNFVALILEASRGIAAQEAAMQTEIDAVKAKHELAIGALRQFHNDRLKGLQTYCVAHRERLTPKKKSFNFPAGTIGWRMTPKSVVLKGVEDLIALIRKRRLGRFLRKGKVTIDKEAMLKEQAVAQKLDGVTIAQTEEFFVETQAPAASDEAREAVNA